jgi:hypothetical protein
MASGFSTHSAHINKGDIMATKLFKNKADEDKAFLAFLETRQKLLMELFVNNRKKRAVTPIEFIDDYTEQMWQCWFSKIDAFEAPEDKKDISAESGWRMVAQREAINLLEAVKNYLAGTPGDTEEDLAVAEAYEEFSKTDKPILHTGILVQPAKMEI